MSGRRSSNRSALAATPGRAASVWPFAERSFARTPVPSPSVPVPTEERSSRSDSLSEPRVLLIEDDDALTTVLAKALADRGFTVDVMTTGAAALESASVAPPDVVVLDLGLPDMDGIDVCRQLRGW